MTETISNSDDMINSRDVIARIEELESERSDLVSELTTAKENVKEHGNDKSLVSESETAIEEWDDDNGDELKALKSLAEEGEQNTSWVDGETLIRESYWVDYCRDLVSDICGMPNEIPSYIEIDWEKTADNLKADYSEINYDGETYLIRSA